MKQFQIISENEVVICEFLHTISPKTCQALEEIMPIKGELHCAKISGDEVFIMVPLKISLEGGGVDISTLGPGTIAYWTDRSLLCFFYKAPKDEEANVNYVGKVIENLDGLGRITEKTRREQGKRMILKAM